MCFAMIHLITSNNNPHATSLLFSLAERLDLHLLYK